MSRNEETFSQAPTLQMQRTYIPLSQNIKTTFNAGYIVPFFVNLDVLPADTWSLSYSAVIRQTTSQTPTMDNAYADFYFFAIPWRIAWDHTKEFFGEADNTAWVQSVEYVIPQVKTTSQSNQQVAKGSLADYFGIPINTAALQFSSLPFRAYQLVYNEYFRDANLIAPINISKGDTDITYGNAAVLQLRKAAKFHDYFTSCLPAPQQGDPVTLPLGTTAPVKYKPGAAANVMLPNSETPAGLGSENALGSGNGIFSLNNVGGVTLDNSAVLYTDLTNAVAATVNAMRYSFAIERIQERMARTGGNRYRTYILGAYGVTNGDARMQIPEYLGGGVRVPLQLLQVAQTSATSGNTALGDLAAFGHTATGQHAFTKSFTEHSIILGLMVVRTDQSYDRGLNRMWSRRRKYDVYDPALAFLGEQAVLNKEIYCSGDNDLDNQVFGYQERWAEMRYLPNIITGAFRTNYTSTLDFWHYGSAFANLPVLSQTFIEETTSNIDRTLVVSSQVEDQFLADIQVNIECYRKMPRHSIPGLLDHF